MNKFDLFGILGYALVGASIGFSWWLLVGLIGVVMVDISSASRRKVTLKGQVRMYE